MTPDGTWSKGIHGDYDLHEVFVQGPDGRWVRVSFGDGSETDNALRSGFRAQFNEALGAPLDMYLHGGQGDWDHPGKTSDPPVTIFAPNSVAQAAGVRSGALAKNAEELRDVFENKLGTGWAYSDGQDDLDPLQGIHRDRHFTSVGGQRWLANRTIPGLEKPADGPNMGIPQPVRGWIPIPMWQAYGLAVDALPKIGVAFWTEYERMTLDGVEVEYVYAHGEANRITTQIDRARENYPDLVLAFLRPPLQSADGRFVPLDPSSLSSAILTDVHSVCEVRRAAAEARRATAAATPRAGVAAFTSAAACDRESEIWDRIQVWVDLAGDTPPISQSIRTSGM